MLVCVVAPQLASIHWHAIECFYYRRVLIESAPEFVCCTVQWFHLSLHIIILQWDIYPHTKVFQWSKIVHKKFWWSRLFVLFWARKIINYIVAIQGDVVFSSIVTTNIQKTLHPTNTEPLTLRHHRSYLLLMYICICIGMNFCKLVQHSHHARTLVEHLPHSLVHCCVTDNHVSLVHSNGYTLGHRIFVAVPSWQILVLLRMHRCTWNWFPIFKICWL